jgi:hypothetical protein
MFNRKREWKRRVSSKATELLLRIIAIHSKKIAEHCITRFPRIFNPSYSALEIGSDGTISKRIRT